MFVKICTENKNKEFGFTIYVMTSVLNRYIAYKLILNSGLEQLRDCILVLRKGSKSRKVNMGFCKHFPRVLPCDRTLEV
jgi:hypothetical protein